MHFSSPSGHRLSWWWPWNRGAVGRLSSGYVTVSTFRNISRKVTPNPLTGLRKSSTGDLLIGSGLRRGGCAADGDRRRVAEFETVVMRKVERRHREAPDRAGLLFFVSRALFLGRELGRAALGSVVPERDESQDQHQNQAGDSVHLGRMAVVAPCPDGRDQQDPDDGQRDEDLPAKRHQLVVPGPGQ